VGRTLRALGPDVPTSVTMDPSQYDPQQDDACPRADAHAGANAHPHADTHASADAHAPAAAHWWTATGHERPVFLDERGRRRRWVLAGGVLAGALAALWLTALLAGAVGFSSLPLAHGPKLSAPPHIAAVGLAERRRDLAANDRREDTLRRTTVSLRRDIDRA
jgi:hypothetical protein